MTAETETTAIVPRVWEGVSAAEVIERVVITGDLAGLTPDQRVAYYAQVCESLGLNPFTRPFDYIRLNNKLTLYAKRDATDQIRRNLNISVIGLTPAAAMEGLYGLVAHVRTPDGREDTGTAYVSVRGLAGDNLANALMKCETKAKRRATLSLAGLGLIDESEIASIPDGELVAVDDSGVIKPGPTTVSDVIAARVAAIEQATDGVDPVASAAPDPDAGVGLTKTVQTSAADVSSAQDETEALGVALDGGPGDDAATESFIEAVVAEDTPTRVATPEEIVDDESDIATIPDDAVLPERRTMDLNEFAAYVANRGDVVPRDEMRAIAATMFPDATGFRMLSDEQRGAIADEVDRLVAERATDDDAEDQQEEAEQEPTAADPTQCGAPSPYGDGTLCDRETGHDGPHGSGNNETW